MPMIRYECECGFKQSKMTKPSEVSKIVNKIDCPSCGKKETLKRQFGAPTSLSKMIIDNGSMAKAIEVRTDVEEIRDKMKTTKEAKDPTLGDIE